MNEQLHHVLALARMHWPAVRFYDAQREIIASWIDFRETDCRAGNKLGKDYVFGFLSLATFLWPQFFWPKEHVALVERERSSSGQPDYLIHTRRIITTSVVDEHLRVLWAEIARFVVTSEVPLLDDRGGPLSILHHEIRFREERESKNPINYLIGQVARAEEKMSGHHAKYTAYIVDECSSGLDEHWSQAKRWAGKMAGFGNPNACENWWRRACDEFDTERGKELHRKKLVNVIKIKAEDSPNVKLGLLQQAQGREPTNEVIVPGVLTWAEYQERRQTWNKIEQCVGLDAEFYTGPELMLFPPSVLAAANERWRKEPMLNAKTRRARGVGIDPGEGQANSSFWAVDERGVIKGRSIKTPDTTELVGLAKAFMKEVGAEPSDVCIDRGGGGKQLADRLRKDGLNVRTIAFGEAISKDIKLTRMLYEPFVDRREVKEDRYTYKNRRAEMYHEASQQTMLDCWMLPGPEEGAQHAELIRQLKVMPVLTDEEGRYYLPPKNRRDESDTRRTLSEMLGCSPDEADAYVLAIHAMLHKPRKMAVTTF